jgi:hypothetical protein
MKHVSLNNYVCGAESFVTSHQLLRQSKNFWPFTATEGSLPCPPEPATEPHSEAHESSPQTHIRLLQVAFHILNLCIHTVGPASCLFPTGFPTEGGFTPKQLAQPVVRGVVSTADSRRCICEIKGEWSYHCKPKLCSELCHEHPVLSNQEWEAVPWLRRLVASLQHRGSGWRLCHSMCDLWWIKWHCNRFFSELSVLSSQYHPTVTLHTCILYGNVQQTR